jgi:hypothetical protein
MDSDAIAGGAVTATQIKAAYEPMEIKSSEFESCVLDFLYGVMKVAGISDEKPSFTRTRIVNTQEEVQMVLSAASFLGEDYVIRKVLQLLGDGDKADKIIDDRAADEMARMQAALAMAGGDISGYSSSLNGNADTTASSGSGA